ncbi:MAG TPA: cupin domain-containing protein [Rubrobacteraceae bacterium]|nr:cupin domain-containing protein [Rubrobacteraceae bacterium]
MSESDTPRRQGAANAPEGIVLGPGEGRTIGGITLKATGEQTAGSIGFLEATTPPGYGPPRHVHYGCDELFYVLEGQFLFLVGERQVSGPPGTFVFIPRGTVHAAKVVGSEPGKVLAAFVPGGQELSFEDFGRLQPTLWPRNTTPSSWGHLYSSPVPWCKRMLRTT